MWLWLWLQQSQAEQTDSLVIHEWYLPNQTEREQGMEVYFATHYGSDVPKFLSPKMVVLHWTGVPSAESTWNTFASDTLGGRRDIRGAGSVNVSAHFLVDRDGTIHRLLPEDAFARHCIGFNHISIGVENVGGTKGQPLTKAQVDANVRLIQDLQTRYPIDLVIGHHESIDFEEHPYFVERDPNYRSIKLDPGTDFMEAVRVGLTLEQESKLETLNEEDLRSTD